MTNENVKTLGERLYELRSEKHMTQEELAERLMIGRQTISKWELNKSIPSTENLIQLAEIYEVSLDYLIKGQKLEQDASGELQQDKSIDIADEKDDENNEIKNVKIERGLLPCKEEKTIKKSKSKIILILAVILVAIAIIFIKKFASRDNKEDFTGFLTSDRTQGVLKDEEGNSYVSYNVPENYQLEYIDIREGVIVNKYDHTEKRIEVQVKLKYTGGQWTPLEEMEQKTVLWGASKEDVLTKDVNGYTVYYFRQNNLDTATSDNYRYRFNCAVELDNGMLYILDCVGYGEAEAEEFETFEEFLNIKE